MNGRSHDRRRQGRARRADAHPVRRVRQHRRPAEPRRRPRGVHPGRHDHQERGGETEIYDLDSFIAPRERFLTDGTLTEFTEWEIAERTEIFGSIAQRFSEYGKSGYRDGEWFEGFGRQTTQFIRTPDGWKMSSAAWDDVPG
ncbi:hypothetical protein ACFQHO_19540 [Actinomadura yumaensis]|uniref:hypothetical protein n=1 Tax=Actinomadura yumaensis TaxID=111807 RepID=UPI0036157ED5